MIILQVEEPTAAVRFDAGHEQGPTDDPRNRRAPHPNNQLHDNRQLRGDFPEQRDPLREGVHGGQHEQGGQSGV